MKNEDMSKNSASLPAEGAREVFLQIAFSLTTLTHISIDIIIIPQN